MSSITVKTQNQQLAGLVASQTSAEIAGLFPSDNKKVGMKIVNRTNSEFILQHKHCARGTVDHLPRTLQPNSTTTVTLTQDRIGGVVTASAVYRRKDQPLDMVCFFFHNSVQDGNRIGFRYYWDTAIESRNDPLWYHDSAYIKDAGQVHYQSINKQNLECWYAMNDHGGRAGAAFVMTSCIW